MFLKATHTHRDQFRSTAFVTGVYYLRFKVLGESYDKTHKQYKIIKQRIFLQQKQMHNKYWQLHWQLLLIIWDLAVPYGGVELELTMLIDRQQDWQKVIIALSESKSKYHKIS